jgi:PEGA domain
MPLEELLFHDGFGDRVLIRDARGFPQHESLLLRPGLLSVPSFEHSLRQRLKVLESFDHPSFVRVRHLVPMAGRIPGLSVISDYSAGTRLTEALAVMETRRSPHTPGGALFLIRAILDAVVAMHRQTDVSHGALAPERVVISDGKVRITDYVMGSALEQLRFSQERYWKELRVAVPASAGASRFDRHLDVAQTGMIALALFAGRPLRDAEHMGNLGEVLADLSLAQPLRTWLLRTLHMDPRRIFVGAVEAGHGLEEAMAEAGVRPSARDLDMLRLRPGRVNAITVRPAPKAPPPMAVVKKPNALTIRRRDVWNGHDAGAEEMFMPEDGRGMLSAAVGRLRGPLWPFVKYVPVLALIGGGFAAARYVPAPAALFSRSGTLTIESKPQGVELIVDGRPRGVTPATLKVAVGRHEVELRGDGKRRVFSVDVSSGARVSQYVEQRSGVSRLSNLKTGE